MIVLSQKRKRRIFEIPDLSEDEEKEKESTKKQRMDEIQEWCDDDAGEEEVINLLNESNKRKDLEETCPKEGQEESIR